jgi:hypothetical protein
MFSGNQGGGCMKGTLCKSIAFGLWMLAAFNVPVTGAEPELVEQYGAAAAEQPLIVRSTADISVFAPVVEAFLETRFDLTLIYEQWGSNDLYPIPRRMQGRGTGCRCRDQFRRSPNGQAGQRSLCPKPCVAGD